MSDRIDFMNLKRQFQNGENEFLDCIKKVCRETAFSGGKYVEKFEKEFADYIGVKYCAGVDSGTGALQLAVRALEIGSGDEVIVPTNTFIATAWGVIHNGAIPVFVDCTNDTWEIDYTKIEEKITDRTKAIIGVHLYGQPFEIDEVKKIADKYNLYLIEDCAQAHGAMYKGKKIGQYGEVACFSFYPGKNLGAFGEAGAVVTNNKKVYDKICLLKNHGSKERYHHEELGFNMRMDGIQGAILSCKLKKLDGWNDRRRVIAQRYLTDIKNRKIKFQYTPNYIKHIYHLFEVQVDSRENFIEYMETNNIYCGMHYPIPCHLQNAFSFLKYSEGTCLNAEKLAKSCVSLPMFPELTDEEIERIIDACNKY